MTARTTDAQLETPPPPAECDGDGSRRYVLSPDHPYLANLAALWSVDPALAAEVDAVADDARLAAEPAKDGSPTVAISAPSGGRVYLHSRYRPSEEACRLIADVSVEEHVVFYVHGLGLGYHLDLLFREAGDAARFFVFERDLALIRLALECRDFVPLIESRRVSWVTAADKAALFERLTPHTALISVGAATVLHPPSLQVAPEFHEQLRGWTDEYAAFTRTSLNTLVLNGRRTAENVARNVGWYVSTPGPEQLRDRHKGQPAVIVSAGPSLRKNKHLLARLKGKVAIIAVQTTLQPLLEMGIEPDYVTSLDYHDICTRFYEKLPPTLNTHLVAEAKATNKIFSLFPGPLTLTGNDYAEQLLREMNLGKQALRAGATVAHLAFYLAEHLGCDPIVFVGQDLGFSDGLCYAPGTSYEDVWRPELSRFCTVEMKQWEQIVRDRYILRRIPDQQGKPMYTEERLFSYLQQFEQDFARSAAAVIDASEGGAAKRGTRVMPLADVIERYCAGRLPEALPSHQGQDLSRLGEAIACLRRRRQEAGEIESVAAQTLPLLQRIHDQIEDQPRVNRLIAQIDTLRARMNSLGACYELVVQLTQKTELQRFQADRRMASSKLNGADKQRRQIARDIENCRGVMEAAAAFQILMDEAVERLRLTFPQAGPGVTADVLLPVTPMKEAA
jgi:hypothetical protein